MTDEEMKLQTLAAFLAIVLSACQTTPQKVETFPRIEDVSESRGARMALERALTDLERIRNGRDPAYAKLEIAFYDGGTCVFVGDGYRIIDHRELISRAGENGMIVGQTVKFDARTLGERPIEYSDAHFEAGSERDGAEEFSTVSVLKAE